MKLHLSVTGAKEIDKALMMMPKDLTHQTLGAAHLSAAKPLVDKAKLLAPEGPTGNLVDSIGGEKTSIKKAEVVGEVNVGARRTRKFRGHHGHLVHDGTKPRATKKGWRRGIMPKNPFLRDAFTQTHPMVLGRIIVEVGRKVYNTMRRYIK